MHVDEYEGPRNESLFSRKTCFCTTIRQRGAGRYVLLLVVSSRLSDVMPVAALVILGIAIVHKVRVLCKFDEQRKG